VLRRRMFVATHRLIDLLQLQHLLLLKHILLLV
jgi:hypothetical protein